MKAENRFLLSVGAGLSQQPVIQTAKKLGYRVAAIDRNPKAPGFSDSDVCVVASTHESTGLMNLIREKLGNQRITGILNRSSGPPVITAAILANAIGLYYVPIETAKMMVNKNLFRQFCRDHHLPIPSFEIPGSDSNLFSEDIEFPVVVKPSVSLVGKSGITIVEDQAALPQAITSARQASVTGDILFEEYLPGPDISLISFVQDGRLVPISLLDEINDVDSSGRVRGRGFAIPSIHTCTQVESQVIDIANSLIQVTNISRSPFMVSFRLDRAGAPYLIEVHLDLGGDLLIEELYPRALPFDFLELAVKMAAGVKPPNFFVREIKPTAIIYNSGMGLNTERVAKSYRANTRSQLTRKINLALAYD